MTHPVSMKEGLSSIADRLSIHDASIDWHDPVDWIQRYFYVYDLNSLMVLYPCQSEPLRYALQRDDNGDFKFDLIVWSWTKKSAKTVVCAAILDWLAYHNPNAPIRIVSNDLKQASSRVGAYVVKSIQMAQRQGYPNDPNDIYMTNYRINTRIDRSETRIQYPNGAVIEMIPLDPKGEAGGNDLCVSVGELWAWDTEKHVNMWTETTPPPTKHGKSLRLVDTYAGFKGRSVVLEPIYEELVENGTQVEFPHNSECYENGRMFGTWVTQHLLKWQVPEYYDSQKKTLDRAEMARIHYNKWSSGQSPFVDIEDFDSSAIPTVKWTNEDVFVSLDAGRSEDAFAITAGCRLAYNLANIPHLMEMCKKYNINPNDYVAYYLIESKAWYPTEHDGKLKFSGYDGSPFDYLQWLCNTYPVYVVTYDPYQLAHFVDDAERIMPANFEEFPQGSMREKADKYLQDIVSSHMLLHNGQHAEVRKHLLNADTKPAANGRVRITKKSKKTKIDLAVSLSMTMYKVREYMVGDQ